MKFLFLIFIFPVLAFCQCAPPTQAYDVNVTAETDVSITVSWTSGSGSNRIVLVKQGKSVDASPSNSTTYTANTAFGSGTQVGTGNYTVYNSTGTSVTVTGLTANIIYTFKVFEYNGSAGSELYNTQSSRGNPLSEYSFTTEYQAVITQAGVRSFTLPVIGDQIHDNRLLRRNKLDGIHTEMDAFWYTGNSVQDFGRLNWVTPTTNEIALVSSPTFTANVGFTFNGTSNYLNFNFTPSTQGVQFTRNSCSVGAFWSTNTGSGTLVSAVVTTPVRISLTSTTLNLNGNTTRTGTNANVFGVYHAVRTSSTNTNYYKSGKQILGNGGENTNGDINTTVYGGARHNTTAGDVADAFATSTLGGAWFGDQLINVRNEVYSNIIARFSKHVPLLGTVSKTGITAVDFFGDSFTVGQAASPIGTEAYVKQFMAYQFSSITETNNAVSGKGCWVAADAANQKSVNNGTTGLWIEMCGQNDIDRNGDATKTVNKHEAWVRTMFINHAADAFIAAGSSSVTRTGAYTNPYDARAQGGRFTSAALPSNSAVVNSGGGAGTVSYTVTNTAIGVQLISDYGSGTFGTCTISLDGVVQNTVDLSSYYDGISDGVNNNQTGPVAFWYTGLTNASHTITVTATGNGTAPVDFFATLMAPSAMKPMIVCENPYRNTYIHGSNASMDAGSFRKFKIAQLLNTQGYPVVFYSVNKYYDRDDIDADQVHPANGGHRQIAGGFNHLFDGY